MSFNSPADLSPELSVIAQSLAVQWPGIEADDIAQEMSAQITERWASLKHLEKPVILRHAKREGVAYCSIERHFWQMQMSEWIYTPREVRTLLAELFSAEAWEDAPKRSEGSNQTVTGDGISVALMDLRVAFEAVAEAHQAVILTTFCEWQPDSSASGRKRLQRAVDAMTDRLNWRMHQREMDRKNHDGPGSRNVLTNTQARHAIDY